MGLIMMIRVGNMKFSQTTSVIMTMSIRSIIKMTLSTVTLSIMTLRISFIIMTIKILKLTIMTGSFTTLRVAYQHNVNKHDAIGHNALSIMTICIMLQTKVTLSIIIIIIMKVSII